MSFLNLNPGIIYFLTLKDTRGKRSSNYYKIGITDESVEKRINQLQTGNPYQIVKYNAFHSDTAQLIEQYLHKKYAQKRVRFEWFTFKEDELIVAIEEAKSYNSKISKLAKKVRELDQKSSNGKVVPPTKKSRGLHEQALDLQSHKIQLSLKKNKLSALLQYETSDSTGIDGITSVTITKPKPGFKLRLFQVRYHDLYEKYCRIPELKCSFRFSNMPTTKEFPSQVEELKQTEAKVEGLELSVDSITNKTICQNSRIIKYHTQFLETEESLTQIEGDLIFIQLSLRALCAENEGIEDICKYERKKVFMLDKKALQNDYPKEYKDCIEEGEPNYRFKVFSSRAY